MARPSEQQNNTFASIRITCDDAAAMQNLLHVLEGALGKPARVSKPYRNASEETRRVYVEFVVPRCSSDGSA